jgi:hypothetical protein
MERRVEASARPTAPVLTTSVEASFVTGGVYTVVAVRNLWNHFYYEPQSFIPEAGRTFAVSLRREFRP